ncbi:MAG: hypothetical protein UX21_C0021G0001, partial [Microgenomates group bacterium GW2011_GWC2_45_8]
KMLKPKIAVLDEIDSGLDIDALKKIMDEESQGMILAVDGKDKPLFVSAEDMPVGAKVR